MVFWTAYSPPAAFHKSWKLHFHSCFQTFQEKEQQKRRWEGMNVASGKQTHNGKANKKNPIKYIKSVCWGYSLISPGTERAKPGRGPDSAEGVILSAETKTAITVKDEQTDGVTHPSILPPITLLVFGFTSYTEREAEEEEVGFGFGKVFFFWSTASSVLPPAPLLRPAPPLRLLCSSSLVFGPLIWSLETKERGRWVGGQVFCFFCRWCWWKGGRRCFTSSFCSFFLVFLMLVFVCEVCLDTRLPGESRDERCQRRCFGIQEWRSGGWHDDGGMVVDNKSKKANNVKKTPKQNKKSLDNVSTSVWVEGRSSL